MNDREAQGRDMTKGPVIECPHCGQRITAGDQAGTSSRIDAAAATRHAAAYERNRRWGINVVKAALLLAVVIAIMRACAAPV